MGSKVKFGIGLTPIILLFTCSTWAATNPIPINEGEKIISCSGERKSSYDPTDTFGQVVAIEVYQIPTGDFRWSLKIQGKTQMTSETNGPINKDGTTVAPNGDEGLIYYRGPGEGVLLKKGAGVLHGLFSYIETTFNESLDLNEYYLVEYELANCQLTGAKIDQREANIYNAKSELVDLAVATRPYWLNGAGVRVSEFGLAEGIGIYAQDQAHLDAFIAEFVKRGLVNRTSNGLVYHYKDAEGVVIDIPIAAEITGDIRPPAL